MSAADPKRPLRINSVILRSSMVFESKKPPTPRFKVFRTIESMVFGLPVAVAYFYDAAVFFSTLAICILLYLAWTNWLKRRLSREDNKDYDAVYETEQSNRLGFQPIDLKIPWSMWLVWLAAIVFPFVYAAIS